MSQFFSSRVQKISVNAGFECPHKQETGTGCAYCVPSSFLPSYCESWRTISQQIEQGKSFFRVKYPDQKYLVYFQAATNTWAQPNVLMTLFNEALSMPDVVGLCIGTRPDSISDGAYEVLSECARKSFVLVELGVESTLDQSLIRCARGHTWDSSLTAITRLASYGVHVGAHLILGIPGETEAQWYEHATMLSALPVETLKIHHLQILKGTQFAREWQESPESFELFTPQSYESAIIGFLEHLRPTIAIERFVNESPESLLIAPRWGNIKNYAFTERVIARMHRNHQQQGDLWNVQNK